MDCPRCNLTNPDTAQRYDCGYDFETKTVEKPYFTSGSRDIGGWLALLIFQLTVGSPILTAINLGGEIEKSGLSGPVIIDCIINIAFISLGVYAGFCLLRIKPNAVRIAKRYLLARFAFAALALMVLIVSVVYQPDNLALETRTLDSLIGSVIWYLYLKKSKRVLRTYAAHVEPIVEIPVRDATVVQPSSHPVKKSLEEGVGSAASDAKRAEGSGVVSVISVPPGADIEVDGTFLGSTPSELPMNIGEHSLIITKKGFNRFERKLRVIPAAKQTISAELEPVEDFRPG